MMKRVSRAACLLALLWLTASLCAPQVIALDQARRQRGNWSDQGPAVLNISSRIYVPAPTAGTPSTAKDLGPAGKQERLLLVNMDMITGDLKGIKDGVLTIANQYLLQEPRIPLEGIKRIYFRDAAAASPRGGDQVHCAGGDILTGALTGMEGEAIVLETSYAGTVGVRKEATEAFLLNSESIVLLTDDFSAGSGLWTFKQGQWKVRDGQLHQEQSSGQRYATTSVEQAGHVSYEWEMISPDSYLHGGLLFFGTDPSNWVGGNGYGVWVEGRTLYLWRTQQNNTNTVVRYNFPEAQKKVKFRVEYDSESGLIEVWANGDKPVIKYKDPAPWKSGSHVTLCTNRRVSFDNVSIRMGSGMSDAMRRGSEKSDLVHLVNKDRISGTLTGMDAGQVYLDTVYGKITLDRKRVLAIVFKKKEAAAAPESASLARLVLRNTNTVTGVIRSLDDQVLTVDTPSAGPISVERSAIKEVVFLQ